MFAIDLECREDQCSPYTKYLILYRKFVDLSLSSAILYRTIISICSDDDERQFSAQVVHLAKRRIHL
jgi:hypothetical protein